MCDSNATILRKTCARRVDLVVSSVSHQKYLLKAQRERKKLVCPLYMRGGGAAAVKPINHQVQQSPQLEQKLQQLKIQQFIFNNIPIMIMHILCNIVVADVPLLGQIHGIISFLTNLNIQKTILFRLKVLSGCILYILIGNINLKLLYYFIEYLIELPLSGFYFYYYSSNQVPYLQHMKSMKNALKYNVDARNELRIKFNFVSKQLHVSNLQENPIKSSPTKAMFSYGYKLLLFFINISQFCIYTVKRISEIWSELVQWSINDFDLINYWIKNHFLSKIYVIKIISVIVKQGQKRGGDCLKCDYLLDERVEPKARKAILVIQFNIIREIFNMVFSYNNYLNTGLSDL